MNRLKGRITKIQSSEVLSFVEVDVAGAPFFSVVVEKPREGSYIAEGNEVYLLFKETEVALGKEVSGRVSILNVSRAAIREIEWGEVLTRVTLDFLGNRVGSVVATRSARELALSEGEEVSWLVKASEVSLMAP